MRTVSAQILVGMVVVLVVTGGVGFALTVRSARQQADRQYQQQALSIANATATMPLVVSTLSSTQVPAQGDATNVVNGLADLVRRRTGASYVVIIDRAGRRWSHPDADLIGRPVSEPVVALDGRSHLHTDHGNLGTSANGRAPVFDAAGRPVGEVSVGVLENQVAAEAAKQVPTLATYFALALVVGVVVAVLLSRRLKRQTFGLELDEIATLLQEREATLHGIHEGVLALDPDGRVLLVNDQAVAQLALPVAPKGRNIDDLVAPGPLADLLSGRRTGRDQAVLVDGRLMIVNRNPVIHQGRDLGAVVSVSDRTELEEALRELEDVRGFTDALRAQQHEFANRIHTVGGLLELGHHDDALRFVSEVTGGAALVTSQLDDRVASPEVAALLVAKATVAAERRVHLEVTGDGYLEVGDGVAGALVTILGNLVDNAIDAAASAPPDGPSPATVTVRLVDDEQHCIIEVADTGPGIPPALRRVVFTDGWSTKPPAGARSRGLGLALVDQLARRLDGDVSVVATEETTFRVTLPRRPAPSPGQ